MTNPARPTEFDCLDCGCHVYAFGRAPNLPPVRCGVCAWIAEYVTDPAEATRIRSRMADGSGLTEP